MASILVEEPMSSDKDPIVEQPSEVISPVEQQPIAPETPQANPLPEPESVQPKKPGLLAKLKAKPAVLFGLAAVLIITAVVIVLASDRNKLQEEVNTLKNAGQVKSATDTQEAEQLKAEVGRLYELPADETPTIATVVDAAKVKNQPFFKQAQNGDKVLLFAKSGKAILYRPTAQKIIEVAPLNLNQNQQTKADPTQPN